MGVYTAQIPVLIQIGGDEVELIAEVRFRHHPAERVRGSLSQMVSPPDPETIEDREVIAIRFEKQAADFPPLTIPEWLSDMLSLIHI